MIAVATPQRDYLSYSAVRTFQGCPLKYRFRYIDGLPAPQAMLRVPCYADGASIVVELNATETLFPQVGVGWSLSAWHNGQMLRVASGQLRRPN